MKLTVDDILSHSFVITIDKERHSLFKRIFKAHGLYKPYPRKLQGVTIWYNSPQYNCSLSHKAAIEKAKKLDWPYVCIFEDDAYPVTGIKEELEKYLSEIPDDCAVLTFGGIFCLGQIGEQGIFKKGIRIYGGHSYILFRDYYDKYLELLTKFPEGDGPLYKNDDSIIPLGQFYGTKRNLFIQYSPKAGMNNKSGYILYYSMKDWNWVKFPDEYIFYKGFPRIDNLLGKGKTEKHDDFPQIVTDKPLVFVTVNAGTNALTNITAKSILMFHPNAKIFVVDVSEDKSLGFSPIDDGMSDSIEVLKGITESEMNLPVVDVNKAKNITDEEKQEIIEMFHGSSRIEVLSCGDFQHPANIQFAIDKIGENFIVLDSDAPIIRYVDDIVLDSGITSAQIETWNYIHIDRLRPLVRKDEFRIRFSPVIQYMNVGMMKNLGVEYFNPNEIQDNLGIAGWFKNPGYDGKESLFFWTGSLFFKKVSDLHVPFNNISSKLYVDHLGGGTWGDDKASKLNFVEKYRMLFKNMNGLRLS